MSSGAKSGILAAIAKTDNSDMKMVFLLLLGVLEELGDKIDAMREDEKGLRIAVLNGHEEVHHEHHEWVARQITAEAGAESDAKANRRVLVETAIRQTVMILVSAAAGVVGALWVLK